MKGYSDFIKLSRLPQNILGIKRTASVKELSFIYSNADVFLNLSYCENYPTVNLEARACGTRIISYKTGGSPESAGGEAIVAKQGDINAVISEIQRMGTNQSRTGIITSEIEPSKALTKNVDISIQSMVEQYIKRY